jgi:hypothetical protein
MNAQHPSGRCGRPRTGPGYSRIQRILALIFTSAAAACWVLVAADVVVGRPAGGNVFIATLNTGPRSSSGAALAKAAIRLPHF